MKRLEERKKNTNAKKKYQRLDIEGINENNIHKKSTKQEVKEKEFEEFIEEINEEIEEEKKVDIEPTVKE